MAFDGLDRSIQRAEAQSLDIIPDRPDGVIGWDQRAERDGSEDDLMAIGGAEPSSAGGDRWLSGSRWLVVTGRCLEERRVVRPGIVGCVHGDRMAAKS
jgi:hypothetical protein